MMFDVLCETTLMKNSWVLLKVEQELLELLELWSIIEEGSLMNFLLQYLEILISCLIGGLGGHNDRTFESSVIENKFVVFE